MNRYTALFLVLFSAFGALVATTVGKLLGVNALPVGLWVLGLAFLIPLTFSLMFCHLVNGLLSSPGEKWELYDYAAWAALAVTIGVAGYNPFVW